MGLKQQVAGVFFLLLTLIAITEGWVPIPR